MIFNRSAGFRFVLSAIARTDLAAAPRLGVGEGPIHRPFPLVRDRRLLSASRFTGASLIPRIRYHDRVYVIAPVTVGQVTPAASGRCQPALTGVGVVPWVRADL
jgi:hypothetical protein